MPKFRRNYITRPIHKWARNVLPQLSATEAEALEAGEVWWEAELFSGHPDWSKLFSVTAPELTEEEQAFLRPMSGNSCGTRNSSA